MTEAATNGGRAIEAARELRRRRGRRFALGAALAVGLPTLLAAIYYGLIASAEYRSVAVVAIESSAPATEGEVGGILPRSAGSRDLQLAGAFIRSRAMVEILIRDHDLVRAWTEGADGLAGLDADASREAIFDHYLGKVRVTEDTAAGTLTLQVRAYSAEHAQRLARAILAATSTKLAAISSRGGRAPWALVEIAEPSMPDAPSEPRRLWGVVTVFAVALALAGVLSLFVAAVREHARF